MSDPRLRAGVEAGLQTGREVRRDEREGMSYVLW
jgi:hypothetical protein